MSGPDDPGPGLFRLLLAEDWERAVVLGLLAVAFLLQMMRSYAGARGTALRHAAIWVLILAGAVLLAGQRDRIAAALMPWRAQETEAGTVELRRGRDGHFHAELTIEGTRVRALVDTGASDLVLAPADAERLGIRPGPQAFTRRARTANGTVRAASVTLDRVALGPLVERQVPALVIDGALDTSLIGMSFLDRFGSFTVAGERLTIRP